MTVETAPSISTKFGNASVDRNGYYVIHSNEKGNRGKKLHRLIFEDFYDIKLDEEFPEGIVIHHLNGDKLCNEIWNLVPMTHAEHSSIHCFPHTEETKRKLSEAHKGKKIGKNSMETLIKKSKAVNSTGYFRVIKIDKPGTKQGFLWVYGYYCGNNRYRKITSVSLKKLKEKVLEGGFEWFVIEEEKARQTCEEYNYNFYDLI